jgi:hypothetical protein
MTNLLKQQYLRTIRSNSAYPVYRATIDTVALLFYINAAVIALGAAIGGLTSMSRSFTAGVGILIFGAIAAALCYFLGRLFKEASLILADIGDSTVDANSRAQPQ